MAGSTNISKLLDKYACLTDDDTHADNIADDQLEQGQQEQCEASLKCPVCYIDLVSWETTSRLCTLCQLLPALKVKEKAEQVAAQAHRQIESVLHGRDAGPDTSPVELLRHEVLPHRKLGTTNVTPSVHMAQNGTIAVKISPWEGKYVVTPYPKGTTGQ